jgi:hypothetical protein
MKKIIPSLLLFGLGTSVLYAQVGINTQNPQAQFHVDGAKDNPTTGTPTAAQQANDVVVTQDGRLGVGTTSPANNIEIKSGTVGTSGIRITNLPNAASLSTDANGDIISKDFETAGVYVTKQRLIIANPNIVITSGSGAYSFRYSSTGLNGYWQIRVNSGAQRQFNTWDVEYYGNNAAGQVWQGRYLQSINPNTWTSLDPNNAAGGSNEYNTMHVYDLGTGAIVRLTTTLIGIGGGTYESLIVEEF